MVNRDGTPQSPQSTFKTITIVHMALLAGLILFGLVVLVIQPEKGIIINDSNVFFYIVPGLALAAIFVSITVFKKQVNTALNKPTVKEKITFYCSALIQRFAFLQGSSLLGIVVYLQTGNLFYLLMSGIIIIYFISIRPTKDRMLTDLNLTSYVEQSSDFSNLQ